MSLPFGNVRPKTWITGTVGPDSNSGDFGFETDNGLFVVSYCTLAGYLGGGDYAFIALDEGPLLSLSQDTTIAAAYWVSREQEMLAVMEADDTLIVYNNSAAASVQFVIAGYHWQPEPPGR